MYLKHIQKHYKVVGSWQPVKVINVPSTLDNILDKARKTHMPDSYYVSYKALPKDVQVGLRKVAPVVEDSSYTSYIPTAFLRLGVKTKDAWKVNFEVPLGEIDETKNDMEAANYMKETSDWEYRDIQLSVE